MKNRKLAAMAMAAILTGNLTAVGAGAVRAENQSAGGASPSVESGRSVEEGLQLLKENLERLIAENADLKAKNVSLQADKVQLQNELSEFQAAVEDLEKKLKEYEDREKAGAEAEKQEKTVESQAPSLPYPEEGDKKGSEGDKEEDASDTEESKADADQDDGEAAEANDSSGDDEAVSKREEAGETEEKDQTDPAGKESSDGKSKKTDPEETDGTDSGSADDPADLKKQEADDDTEAAEGADDDTGAAKTEETGDEAADTEEGENKEDAGEGGEASPDKRDADSISWTSVDGEEAAADQTAVQKDPDEDENGSGSEEAAKNSDDSDLVSMEPVPAGTGEDAGAQKEQVKEPVSIQNDPVFARTYIGTDMIVTVQNTLIENGYPCGRIDGVLGQGTASQISAWEEDNGLPPTGAISDALVEGLLGFSLPGSSDVVRSSEASNVPMDEAMILSIDLSDQGRQEDTYQVGVEVKSTVPAALADVSVTLVYYDQYGDKLAEDTLRCGHTLPYGQSWKDTSVLRGERESWDVATVGVSSCTYRLEKPDAYGFTEYSIDLQTGLVTGKA